MRRFYSETRRRMYRRCPREYFFHYGMARGGFDPDAPESTRRCHLLKHLSDVGQCAVNIVSDAVHELLFAEISDEDLIELDQLEAIAMRHCRLAVHEIMHERHLADHAALMLRELYYRQSPPEALFDDLRRQVKKLCSVFAVQPQLAGLKRDGAPVAVERPLRVDLDDVGCWCNPLGAIKKGGKLYFLEFAEPESHSTTALLHKYYAKSRLFLAPDRVESFFIDPEQGAVVVFDHLKLNISDELDHIAAAAAEFPADLDNCDMHCFARSEDDKNCSNCRFQELCREDESC